MGPIDAVFNLDKNTGDFGTVTNLQSLQTAINGQLAMIDISNNVGLAITYMDASMVNKYYMVKTDASIALKADKTYAAIMDVSINLNLARNVVSEASLGRVDASINRIFSRHNFTEASVGQLVRFRTDLGVGLKDASGIVRDLVMIDSSVFLKVAATSWAVWNASIKTLG
jgi:hypothetical protein